jgi:hypothetical protein
MGGREEEVKIGTGSVVDVAGEMRAWGDWRRCMERWTWSGLVWSCHNAIGRVDTLLCRTTERGCGKTAVHMSAGRDVVASAGVGVLTTGAYLLTDPATCRGQSALQRDPEGW